MFDLKYRDDPDLEFLKNVDSKKLSDLVSILLYDKVGKSRPSASDDSFDWLHIPELERDVKNWQICAAEIQHYGGNSLVNFIRRKGVSYKEIVDDVLSAMKIKTQEDVNIEEKEKVIFEALKTYLNQLPEQNENTHLESIADVSTIARELLDESDAMEKTLDAIAKKNISGLILKIVGGAAFVYDPFLIPIYVVGKMAAPNWSLMVQSILQVSMLRKSGNGLSLAIAGMAKSGKTTFLKILQNGKFEQIDVETISKEINTFYSELLNKKIEGLTDFGGTAMFRVDQNNQCATKDMTLFLFNPQEVLNNESYCEDFVGRCSNLRSYNVKYIATHYDEYGDDVKEKFINFLRREEYRALRSIVEADKNLFFVNLTDVDQSVKPMLDAIFDEESNV